MTKRSQYLCKSCVGLFFVFITLLFLTGCSDSQEMSVAEIDGCSSMGNPAYTYCTEIMGYDYRVTTDEDGGQDGVCILPDGLECPQWDFYAGKCGLEHSYCAQNGFGTEIKNDGKDPYSQIYPVCVDNNGNELGTFWSLSDYDLVTKPLNFDDIDPGSTETASIDLPQNRDVPTSFDWRSFGGIDWMTSVKNQLNCGSCWAFCSVGLAEAQNNIIPSNPNIDMNLAEQYLVSTCFGYGDCGGGVEVYALEYIRDSGIPDEACYPYTAVNSLCSARCSDYASRLEYVPNAHWSSSYTEQNIKNIISSYGPVTLAIGVDTNDAGFYKDGDIFRCTHDIPSDGSDYVDHGVLAVGYNDGGGYWIVKNSWGSSWNEDGYFKLGYNECNVAHSRISWVESDLPNTSLAPIANAGPDQTVTPGTSVMLDGSGSYDPDGEIPITYQWEQTLGTTVTLSNPTSSMPTFTSPATPGKLTFRLVVTDSEGLPSSPDYVNVFNGIEPVEITYLPLILGSSNPIINGNFEQGRVGWTEYSSGGFILLYGDVSWAQSGSWLAYLGGYNNALDYISQSFTVPASHPYLHFYYYINSEDYCIDSYTAYDYGYIVVNDTTLAYAPLCETNNSTDWGHYALNLSAYAGKKVTLRFQAETDGSLLSDFYIDTVFMSASESYATDKGSFLQGSPTGVEIQTLLEGTGLKTKDINR